jgi:hypothetical protein
MYISGRSRGGYDIYLPAAMHKKEVPIVIVADKSKADFELSGVTESDKAGWAKIVFWGNSSRDYKRTTECLFEACSSSRDPD